MPVSPTSWGVPASQRKVRKKTLPWLECISDSNICQRGLLLAVYLHEVNMNFNFYFTNPIFRKTPSKYPSSFKYKWANSSKFYIFPGLEISDKYVHGFTYPWGKWKPLFQLLTLLSGTHGLGSLKVQLAKNSW